MQKPDFSVYAAFLRAITFRPVGVHDGFGALRTSSYGAILVGLLFAALAETLAVHLGMAYFLGPDYLFVHVIVGAVHLYGIAWIIGDWRLMREGDHTIDEGSLFIDLGQRWRGVVPIASIADIHVGEVDTPDILQGEKRPDHVLAVTPFDAPNLTLVLTRPATLSTYFGLQRTGTELQLFVDRPGELCEALHLAQAAEVRSSDVQALREV